MKKQLAVCFIVIILLAVCGCSSGEKLDIPAITEVKTVSIQEFKDEQAVSRKIPLGDISYWQTEFPDRTYFDLSADFEAEEYKLINGEAKIPAKGSNFVYEMQRSDGSTLSYCVFDDEKYSYIEETGGGIWRTKQDPQFSSLYQSAYRHYEDITFWQAYTQYATEKDFSLLPEYNGSGKMFWIRIPEDGIAEYNNASMHICDDLLAERAEDVRYVVLSEFLEKEYEGYWHDVKTGQNVGSIFIYYDKVSIYDLMSGTNEVLFDKTVSSETTEIIVEKLESYIAEKQ